MPAGLLHVLVLAGLPSSLSVKAPIPFVPVNEKTVPFSGWVCRMIVRLPLGEHSLSRLLDCSHGEYSTLAVTLEPLPDAMEPGPVKLPHQLHAPSTSAVSDSVVMPVLLDPTARLLRLM